ncbi:MAG TPA: hypothetical protein VHE99_00015 [Gammaproteobacteria bacterium]|nr:hypothetical protein [Gammaproteobacteria bacterium]
MKLDACYQIAFETITAEIFINLLKTNEKPKSISHSIYIAMLATQLLERIGNHHPTQREIDAVILILTRYRGRQKFKDIYKNACIEDEAQT